MAEDERLAENWRGLCIIGRHCPRSGVYVLYRKGVHLASPCSRGVGEIQAGILYFMAMCVLCLFSAIGWLVDFWNGVWIYIWHMEGVGYLLLSMGLNGLTDSFIVGYSILLLLC